MKKRFIVLDLDGTLIYSKPCEKEEANLIFPEEHFNCIKRPGLDEFLLYIDQNMDGVIVWSAGSPDYVEKVINHIFPYKPDLVFDSRFCQDKNNEKVDYPVTKPLFYLHKHILDKMGGDLEELDNPYSDFPNRFNSFIVDDREEIAIKNPGLHLKVKEFMGDMKDDELYRVMDILDTM